MKITEALLAEHVVFHNLFDHVDRAIPNLRTLAEVHVLADLMITMLEAHSKVEDQLLLEPLEHCIEQLGQHDTFHQEHEEIDAALRQLRRSRSLKTARALLQTAVVASRNHFDKEERLIFPMAEEHLKTKTLAQLGQAWREKRKTITTIL